MKRFITLSIIATSFLFAQEPTISDVQKSIKPPKEVSPKESTLIDIQGKEKFAPPMSEDKSGKTLHVKDFEIEGNTQIEADELKNLLNEYMQKDLNFSQLQDAASTLTKYYRKKVTLSQERIYRCKILVKMMELLR